MNMFNRKAKQEVTKKPEASNGSKNSKSKTKFSPNQKRREVKKSDSDTESSHKNTRRGKPVPAPPSSNSKGSNDKNKRKSVQEVVKKVVNHIPFSPSKQPTSTPPVSEGNRKRLQTKVVERSNQIESEMDSFVKKIEPNERRATQYNHSNSLSGSNEAVPPGNVKRSPQKATHPIRTTRSLIGLDGETEAVYSKTSKTSPDKGKVTADSPRSRRTSKSLEENSSEANDSISLADDEETREAYRKLFKDFAMSSQKMTLDDFKQEFSNLPGDPPSDLCTAFNQPVNNKKNRYLNIPCLDISRVQLKVMPNKNSTDYIHANYIRSPFLKRGYILTQGPKKETRADFWRMIWQENTTAIVMLCQFTETNREKCAEYFPRNAHCCLQFDKMSVSYEDSTVNKSLVTTRLNLSYEGETRLITHWLWKEWPDWQVPGSSEVMLKILRKIRARSTPPVIHCSAGVGRSGTLMAVEIALQSIHSHFTLPDIKQIVSHLRVTGRAASVQTLQQYMLIWKVLLDFGVAYKQITEELAEKFNATYRRSLRSNNGT
ncbi:Protein-tyrosine phosphatase [Caenorhabditis elegans]|uniref:Protein-tyrosine phosphatase n=1 Tax=Caenorhabditis elegans TaxID=6239 RepID=V6CJI9_CAEEL|nr:Protein-tyrosine phosphatase [Caenorhabditis elegans]NP_001293839.1 Protein-tyrosine phosphatase [Caenorhabditis elegans]CDK13606.1 Protein-tyrosine phosphatase [Caenorhabditis elegans]CDK13607.1 Protein-tyrosine phosphatase [Caenorhabditis elegans]|eukprot:NP_001293838.1 Tyrosine-protein phosphatase [Caenorhabditis elegans]